MLQNILAVNLSMNSIVSFFNHFEEKKFILFYKELYHNRFKNLTIKLIAIFQKSRINIKYSMELCENINVCKQILL